MAVFRYRMQNILSVKEKLETQAKNEFAIAIAELNDEQARLEAIEQRIADLGVKLAELSMGTLDVMLIRHTEEDIETLKYHADEQRIKVIKAEQKVDAARQKLTDAVQDRKTHEKLKERQFNEFLAEEAAKESKEIDELVSYRFGQAIEEQ